MEVIIDGVKYIPESYNKVRVHGIEYEDIKNWLYSIRCYLVNEWFNLLEDGQVPNSTPEQIALFEKRQAFDKFVEEYLGFIWAGSEVGFVEKGGDDD